jgi:hypothetical protein
MSRPVGVTPREQQSVLARARAVRAQFTALLDSFLASGVPLDPARLADLDRFIHAEAYPAARAYEQLLLTAGVNRLQRHDERPDPAA